MIYIIMNINVLGNTLILNEFDIKSLFYDDNNTFINPRIAIIGASGTGKSWIIREIFYNMRNDIGCGIVIAPTDKMNKFYDDFIPSSYIYHEYSSEIIPKLLTRQKKIIEKNDSRIKIGKKEIDTRSFFIMDDCMASKHLWLKDPNILEIMNQGRHFKLSYILSMQYCLSIMPELRTQFNYIFILGEDNAASRKKLHDHWCGVIPSFSMFETIFMQTTANYGCLVVNNRIKSTDLTKKIFWFRAKEIPNFKIGSIEYKKYHDDNYDPNYLNKSKLFDITNYTTNKRSNLIVKLIK